MLDWQVWLRSLTPAQRVDYRVRHPEPSDWQGFYDVLFSRPAPPDAPESQTGDAYWTSLERHYETVFGTA